jgi:hypothetical protein
MLAATPTNAAILEVKNMAGMIQDVGAYHFEELWVM